MPFRTTLIRDITLSGAALHAGVAVTMILSPAPAGQGDVDVKAILEASPNALRVVEFDAYRGDVFEGIAESLAWLAENDKA